MCVLSRFSTQPVAIGPPVSVATLNSPLVSADVAAGAQSESDLAVHTQSESGPKLTLRGAAGSRVRVTVVMMYEVKGAALGLSTLTQTLECSASGCVLIARSGAASARPTAPAHIVDTGTAPALAARVDAASGSVVVAAVHSDAFCANNEKRNKQVGWCYW